MVSLELCLGLRAGRWRGIVVFVGFFGTIWRDVPPGCWLSATLRNCDVLRCFHCVFRDDLPVDRLLPTKHSIVDGTKKPYANPDCA